MNKKVILTLLFCILVPILVTCISRAITDEELKNYANTEMKLEASRYQSITSIIFMTTEWTINSFLSAFMEIHEDTEGKESIHIISSDKLKSMDMDRMYESMESFISYSSSFYSCVLTFIPGVVNSVPDGISAAVYSDHEGRFNLLEHKNIYETELFKQVAVSKRTYITNGTIRDSIKVWTCGIPIFDEKGKLAGELWMDVLDNKLSDYLNSLKSERDLIGFVLDKDCRIVASTDESMNEKFLWEMSIFKEIPDFANNWLNKVTDFIDKNTPGHFSITHDGKSAMTFVSKLKSSPYFLVLVKKKSSAINSINKIMNKLLLVSAIGIILIVICLLHLFMVFKRQEDNDRQIKSELEIASKIQKSILPDNLYSDEYHVRVSGFQKPAKSVGGDLYGFFRKGDKLHFCIGDVSGKGVPAALLMTEICSIYYLIAKNTDNAGTIVRTLNATAMENCDDKMICTMFVGVLDLNTGHLDFCNAGHNPPILISSGIQKPEYLKIKANMPINAFENYDFKTESIELKDSDRLLLYTDGVTESMNSEMKFLGKEATLEILQKHREEPFPKLVDSLMHEIAKFMHHAEQNDDITLLCIEYENQS